MPPTIDEGHRSAGSTPLLALDLPARAEVVPAIRRQVVAFGRRQGLGERVLADVALAVSEAATNVVRHAYDDGEAGRVQVVADLEGDDLQVVVSDVGHGIRPGSPPGLGMGLSIIASVADDFSVSPQDPRGMQVWMRFLRAPAGA
jgi:serine/threonine-protein kinase RsbW